MTLMKAQKERPIQAGLLAMLVATLSGCASLLEPDADPIAAEDRAYEREWAQEIHEQIRDPAIRAQMPALDPALDPVTSRRLERFANDAEFDAWLKQLGSIWQDNFRRWAGPPRPRQYAALQPDAGPTGDAPPCPDFLNCPPGSAINGVLPDMMEIIVTGTRVRAQPSITNNQTAGVDEGDIVKAIGDYLIVLQDGRLFSVDTRNRLRLSDRLNVYRDVKDGGWYDEMLVDGDHILVTAYSSSRSATEISVFQLDETTGKISARGVYLISSNDYYDDDNYATRIVDGKLLIYTPLQARALVSQAGPPMVRRLVGEQDTPSQPLVAANKIYKPVLQTIQPWVHSVSLCPLGPIRGGADLLCETTGFVGPRQGEMFVSPRYVYMMVSHGARDLGHFTSDCPSNFRARRDQVQPSAVYRVPVNGGAPRVAGVLGAPVNQFSMDEQQGDFLLLAPWRSMLCEQDEAIPMALATVPEDSFSTSFSPISTEQISALPNALSGDGLENRFTSGWLAYGTDPDYFGTPPSDAGTPVNGQIIAVPLQDPASAQTMALGHSVIRIEAVGDGLLINGYRDNQGLSMSYVRLGTRATLRSTMKLEGRIESENRSHAFNSARQTDASYLMGLPTTQGEQRQGRWYWRSDDSDLSFARLSRDGQLTSLGTISKDPEQASVDSGYRCEVSCIDWYGNARPIFLNGRVFALMGTNLVEARLGANGIEPIYSLNMTRPPG